MSISGIGLPGHFIVKATNADQEILLDPFDGGRILTLADCVFIVQKATGMPFEASPLALDTIPLGLMIQRMLTNLKLIYLQNQDWLRSIRIMERQRQLNPQDVALRRDLGVCYVRHAQPGKAIDHLRDYLDKAQEADDLDTVEQFLNTALKLISQWN
jgi:regulator of sirC expression with transglutaminase-like and TPR domain